MLLVINSTSLNHHKERSGRLSHNPHRCPSHFSPLHVKSRPFTPSTPMVMGLHPWNLGLMELQAFSV
ncbi:hypothetical protein C8Q76DRAFT_702754 [Earliella scabrosa]|nr:hypothetical protein C8Q76DRAFT_702754 [Earliella scabrosa]